MSASRTGSNVERRFVTTPLGRIHVAMAGTGFPVLLLHQTPRSWTSTAMCCRCSAAISARSRWTRSVSGIPIRLPATLD